MPNFNIRASGEELMDNFDLQSEELTKTLTFLENVNLFLGGYAVLLSGIKKVLKKIAPASANASKSSSNLTILDAGCGSGDALRAIAKWNKKRGYSLNYLGIDANEFIVEDSRKKSAGLPNMQFVAQDLLSEECSFKGVDIVVCGLFLHHLSEEEQVQFIQKCLRSDVQAILVNDLHRHWLGYYLFYLICAIVRAPYMAKHDGLLSILKAFKRSELINLMQKTGIINYELRWKWAFRYQLIAYKKC